MGEDTPLLQIKVCPATCVYFYWRRLSWPIGCWGAAETAWRVGVKICFCLLIWELCCFSPQHWCSRCKGPRKALSVAPDHSMLNHRIWCRCFLAHHHGSPWCPHEITGSPVICQHSNCKLENHFGISIPCIPPAFSHGAVRNLWDGMWFPKCTTYPGSNLVYLFPLISDEGELQNMHRYRWFLHLTFGAWLWNMILWINNWAIQLLGCLLVFLLCWRA